MKKNTQSTKPQAKTCSHKRAKFNGYCGDAEIYFNCPTCGEISRKSTKEEAKKLRAYMKKSNKDKLALHRIYRDYIEKVEGRLKGYDLMEAAEKWAKKHPEIQSVRVDDDRHASSDLVIMPHENGKDFMGLTMLYIPQCTGERPIRFFLYPRAIQRLIEALSKHKSKKRNRDSMAKELGFKYA